MSKFLDLFKKYKTHNKIEKTMRNRAQKTKNSNQPHQHQKNKKHHIK